MKPWLHVTLILIMSGASSFAVPPVKSKPQVVRDSAWKDKMTEKKMETGQPLHDFMFLGLQMGATKADVESAIKLGPNKVTLSKPAEKTEYGEILAYDGNHKLAKIRATELAFFEDRLIRITVIFETENVDITYPALVANLEAKYGAFPEQQKQGRNLSKDIHGISLSVKTQRGSKGEEIVITVLDPDMLDKQRETRIEKERGAIGEF